MPNYRRSLALIVLLLMGIVLLIADTQRPVSAGTVQDQPRHSLTPLQAEIEKQRQRLSAVEIEDRREALMKLRALQHPDASRAALSALRDPAPIVRATATAAVLWLPAMESAASLIPLLDDKEEFVRQQTAYALGHTRSHSAVGALIERLTDKKDSVRGASAVALGQIGHPQAVTSLAALLDPQAGLTTSKKSKKSKREQNVFVLRAAARSLGQIRNKAALPALILVLQDKKAEGDVRREAAVALGLIGDAAAFTALGEAATAADPYLAEAAHEAIKKISRSQITRGI